MKFTKAVFEKRNTQKAVLEGSLSEAIKQGKKEGFYSFVNGHLTTNQFYSIKSRLKNNLKVEFASQEVENEFYAISTLNVALKDAGYKGYVLGIIENTESHTDFKLKYGIKTDKGEYVSKIAKARYSIDKSGKEIIQEIKSK